VHDSTSRRAGAYAGKLLRDIGADVVVAGECADDAVGLWLHGGKRRVDRAGAPQLRELADIVITDTDTDEVTARPPTTTTSAPMSRSILPA
jgi:hypothetical protein